MWGCGGVGNEGSGKMMKDTWTDRLSEYLDGTLAVGERAALEAHLAGCAVCAATLEELEGALVEGRRTGRLDSTTVRILERNLATIDTAIAQARRALAADPGSAYLNHHLADTMRRKLELLRQATALTGTQS